MYKAESFQRRGVLNLSQPIRLPPVLIPKLFLCSLTKRYLQGIPLLSYAVSLIPLSLWLLLNNSHETSMDLSLPLLLTHLPFNFVTFHFCRTVTAASSLFLPITTSTLYDQYYNHHYRHIQARPPMWFPHDHIIDAMPLRDFGLLVDTFFLNQILHTHRWRRYFKVVRPIWLWHIKN